MAFITAIPEREIRPDQPVRVKSKKMKLTIAAFRTIQTLGVTTGIIVGALVGAHVLPVIATAGCAAGVVTSVGSLYTEWRYRRKRLAKYDIGARSAADLLLAATDASEEVDEVEDVLEDNLCNSSGEINGKKVKKDMRTKFVRLMVLELGGTVGHLKHTEANRLVISDHARKLMAEHGMRPKHIGIQLSRVIEAYFFPSIDSIELRRAAIYAEMQDRLKDAKQPLTKDFLSWVLHRSVQENRPAQD